MQSKTFGFERRQLLLSLELSDDNCVFMRELLGWMRRLYQLPERDSVVDNLLVFFGRQSQPYLTEIQNDGGEDVFFNFTAIPGEGYRILSTGTPVKFELVEDKFGAVARNVQKQS